ncbi:MAG: 2-C-methyl-D-erythritol 2,4-cyclodiphosphate synthase, partial [Candidatus Kapaibacteriota bacterium]
NVGGNKEVLKIFDAGLLVPPGNVEQLEKVLEKLKEANRKILNIDVTIIFELKKLSPYKQQIRMKIAELCGVDFQRVNVKAKTNEKMGFIGRGEGIASFCICQIE